MNWTEALNYENTDTNPNSPQLFESNIGAHVTNTLGVAGTVVIGENFGLSYLSKFSLTSAYNFSTYFNYTNKNAFGRYDQNIWGTYLKTLAEPISYLSGSTTFESAALPVAAKKDQQDKLKSTTCGEIKVVQGYEFKWCAGYKVEKKATIYSETAIWIIPQ